MRRLAGTVLLAAVDPDAVAGDGDEVNQEDDQV
jgi:hypothetical protein